MDDTAPSQTTTSISPPQKEQESVSGVGYLERVGRQPEIPPEVEEIGVQPISGPSLTAAVKRDGLEEAKEEVPVTTTPQGLVKLPLTETEARSVLRLHKKITEAIVWLANFVLRQFKVFRLRQKETYGNP